MIDRRQFLWLAAAGTRLLAAPTAWHAKWITLPGASPFEFGVYHFRKTFTLTALPAKFLIHVTADNRYQLYVNGARVSWGPARSDLNHWHYDSVDIAKHLRAGANVIASVVWNDGRARAVAQISSQTGFLLQGDTSTEELASTGPEWFGISDRAYQQLIPKPEQVPGYYVVSPGEFVEGAVYPWGWTRADFEDGAWRGAEIVNRGAGTPREARDGPNRWMLEARSIPMMEETSQQFSNMHQVPWTIPAQSRATLLLDQGHLTTAYPELLVSGGRGGRVTLRYAESLYNPGEAHDKGNRNETAGKVFLGPSDIFAPDGSPKRAWRPLYWRTFRYVEVGVETGSDPLTIDDLHSTYTGYPFEHRAKFDAANPELARILDVGWRTARLCAHETYMDCPYYEQLQYAGDTRIQCMVSVYNAGDTRLMRNAIAQIDASRTAEGATFSRAPSALQQYIPGFSLWWIGMLHDYWMYADDAPFVASVLPGVRAVLSFFAALQKPNGSLGKVPWWNYVDWVEGWPNGVPPHGTDDSSAPQDFQLLLALNWSARMEAALGKKSQAADCLADAEKLRATVRALYWDAKRGLFADTAQHDKYSQHTNALAVLALDPPDAKTIMEKTLTADLAKADLAKASVYFRYYLHSAMVQAGLGDRYIEMLAPWSAMLAQGCTTWPEVFSGTSRSDCHAWGASPNIELFRTVLGVDSSAPGWRRVTIRPHLGNLTRVSGTIPHPKGEISVSLTQASGEVKLPPGVDGELRWRGITRALPSGVTKF